MNQEGYTLVEVLVAFFVLGILVSFSLPILSHVKQVTHEQSLNKEAVFLLQEYIERLRSACPRQNKELQFDRIKNHTHYRILWNCVQREARLWEWKVEIIWNQINGGQQKQILIGNWFQ
ncbi:prepilin-type N-terminal cleavage/methylation domain-containing protein [Seinonella peptonophila]|uniref:Prepilin-type N-terminal cleavage/methylation domain-containing protein n=1 Tax=Seinonella peptonophila TaxID=112248 RepID=A0A1M4V4A9_9BACL|nr:type II secretion system protein [Seinonella peptonophila]SHE63737.1 prepilin-type N-terminal cleavage/methylation domain-containing protein [Seinonella peptonophila]